MIKVYQTKHRYDRYGYNERGNCLQAAFASLFELPLESVPHFLEYDSWALEIIKFAITTNYDFNGTLYNKNVYKSKKAKRSLNELPNSNGIDGYFVGIVYSPKWYNPNDVKKHSHAVIVDNNYNIIHDVNHDNKNIDKYPEADIIGFNGILNVYNIVPRN